VIQNFFNHEQIKDTARNTKFVQRASPWNEQRLDGQRFLQASVFAFIEDPQANLDDLAQTSGDLGVKISPQGFDQRINPQAVAFLKEMFVQANDQFKNNLSLPLPILQQFSAINITDSTVLALPESMVEAYPGCGGDGPEASLKIQLNFEFLYGNLSQIVLRPGREPDRSHRTYLDQVQPGSLNINDLGYFVLDSFKTIEQEKQAYYLSRFLPQTGLLTPEGETIDLPRLLRHQPREAFELDVLMGKEKKHRLPCRLICLPVPKEVADRRRQKAKLNAQRKGRTISRTALELMDWTIFVTNVPQSMLSIEQVALLYRVRWQIELVFKLWKSYGGLKHLNGRRRERVLFELYAKMIGLVLTNFLLAPLRMPQPNQVNREISPVKVREIFQRSARDLNRNLAVLADFVTVLVEMLQNIERFGFKQKRKKHPNVCHALALASAIHALELDADQEVELLPLLA
jgi:hypothetical protein